jgi:hypothetical protein
MVYSNLKNVIKNYFLRKDENGSND